jgi:hypothetical protein
MRCPSVVLVALACASALPITAPAWSASATTNGPAVIAPITLAELAGQWVADDWATSLETTRSPRAAAAVATALAFTLEPEGELYRLAITSFHEATWRLVQRADAAPGEELVLWMAANEATEVERRELTAVRLHLLRDPSGRIRGLRGALWGDDEVTFRRLDEPLERFVNRTVLAGSYREAMTGTRFTLLEAGVGEWPGGIARSYRVELDVHEACCDLVELGGDRYGFAWEEGVLRLYPSFYNPLGCPLSCASEPFAVLVPTVSQAWRGGARELPAAWALTRATMAPVGPSPAAWWTATGGGVELGFANPDLDPDPIGFNDPPFPISHLTPRRRCVASPGNAARDRVWIADDGSLAAYQTWSGSNTGLDVVDTVTCRTTASLDANGGEPAVDGTTITVDPVCQPEVAPADGVEAVALCAPAAIWRLRANGTVELLAEPSRARTRAMLGVDLAAPARVIAPYTGKARLGAP